ncbi:MAG: hypothetical protein R3Y29_02005 [bacterium]
MFNKKNKLLKKCMAKILCMTMFVGMFPAEVALANNQKHVNSVYINSYGSEHPNYNFDILWKNPITWDTLSNDTQDGPTQYSISKRNAIASTNQFEDIYTIDTSAIAESDNGLDGSYYPTIYSLEQSGLNSGTLYEYKVVPIHYHRLWSQNAEAWYTAPASYDSSTPLETTLFLTDMEISASGKDNTLTVVFDKPTYEGRDVFPYYKLSYQQGGSDVGNVFNGNEIVHKDNLTVVGTDASRNGVVQVSYDIVSSTIQPGSVYAVKVEPMIDEATEIRDPNYSERSYVEVNGTYKHVSYNPRDSYSYRTDDATVALGLEIEEDGNDYIRLIWGDLNISESEIYKIQILTGDTEDNTQTLIGELYGMNAITVNTWRLVKPTNTTYYQIKVYLNGSGDVTMDSVVSSYDPSKINITPNTPNLFGDPNVSASAVDIDLYWDVFERSAYSDSELSMVDPDTNMLIDRDVYYTFYVTDELEYLNSSSLPSISEELTEFTGYGLKEQSYDRYEKKVYTKNITEYYTRDEDGYFVTMPLSQNKTYYVRLETYKLSTTGAYLDAPDVEVQIYVEAVDELATPQAITTPPLRFKKDNSGNDMITQTEMTLEWNTSWYEVYNPEDETWHTRVALIDDKLVYGSDLTTSDILVDFYDLSGEMSVYNAFVDAGYSDPDSLVIRQIDISQNDIQYEMIYMPFDEINESGGYEKYIAELLATESDLWESIDPTFTDPRYAEYYINGLQKNTRYAALLRPYRITTEGKKESYPAYILGTTLPDDIELDITPTTPALYPVSTSEITLTVEWPHDLNSTTYELAVDEILKADPSTSTYIFDSTQIAEGASSYKKDESDTTYLQYEMETFFPETGFYIWIRSLVGNNYSDWSNAIYMTTDSIVVPDPPQGFGPASYSSLAVYNSKNNAEYVPTDPNYLILEWRRDQLDKVEDPISELEEEEPVVEPIIDVVDIPNNYLAKFNNLLANKVYYARAKTKVHVTKVGNEVNRYYTYIVQVSINSDFKDYITIEMPTIDLTADRYLSAESGWTNTLRLKTDMDKGGDYDENIFDDLYPLPNDDFEIIYDEPTETLIYRFRGNSIDANGDPDNLVDQRLISTLINNKVFNYDIDLTTYEDKSIANRVIQMPYSIVTTMQERKITLSVTMGDTRISLNPGFTDTYQAQSIGTLSDNSSLTINIKENTDLPSTSIYQSYTTEPQKISMTVENEGRSVNLTYTGSEMDIYMATNNPETVSTSNISAYRDIINSDWQAIDTATHNLDRSIYQVKTTTLGNYTTIGTTFYSGSTTESGSSGADVIDFNNKIRMTDVIDIQANEVVTAIQLNNIMSSIASNKQEFSVNTALSSADQQSLARSTMLVGGDVVSREAAISSLVQLYELKVGYRIEPVTTSYADSWQAHSAYQSNIVKASDVGFFKQNEEVDPKEPITWGDMTHMVNIILYDSAY